MSYHFRVNGDFSHMYFVPQLKGFPLELGTGAGVQKCRMMGLPGRKRSLSISPAVWIQYMLVTDRLTPGDSKDRTYRCVVKIVFVIFLEFLLTMT